MDKVIYFDSTHCDGNQYFNFLDYAFQKSNCFMLVYVNYYGKGYTSKQKYFRNALEKYKIKSRTNPKWPGTLKTYSAGSTYKIVFYKTEPKAKDILKEVQSLFDWSRPSCPEYLAFFIDKQCWFYSVGHEKIAAIIHADEEDLNFLEYEGIALQKNAFLPKDNYFQLYDE